MEKGIPRSERAGRYVAQPQGYRAFVPKALPPRPPLAVEGEILSLLSQADQELGRLDGIAVMIPNPDFFLAMYVRKEAVLSSQIEGTQTSLLNLLEFEAKAALRNVPADVGEVVRYIDAMNYGLERLKDFPLSLRLLREIHARLLAEGRGAERKPGEFRRTQNWVGTPGCTLATASFVPPPPAEMMDALSDLEKFIHAESDMPALIKCGLIHAQFETIHPFLDGNGRLGRLLIAFFLCQQQVLRRPMLYLSYYLKQHRQEYYDRLTAVREIGDWEGWLRFFLRGVIEIALEARNVAQALTKMREEHRALLERAAPRMTNALRLLEELYQQPVTTIGAVQDKLRIGHASALRLVALFAEHGLLKEITMRERNRVFAYAPYLELFLGTPVDAEVAAALTRRN